MNTIRLEFRDSLNYQWWTCPISLPKEIKNLRKEKWAISKIIYSGRNCGKI